MTVRPKLVHRSSGKDCRPLSAVRDKPAKGMLFLGAFNAVTSKYQNLILFDGVCNLCTSSVRFIIRHDREAVFKFLSIQSELGRELYSAAGFDPDDFNTLVLLTGGRTLARSDAALEIVKQFAGVWRMFAVFRIVPSPLRDWVYGVIARNRYRWFGRHDTCMIPTEDIRQRFLG